MSSARTSSDRAPEVRVVCRPSGAGDRASAFEVPPVTSRGGGHAIADGFRAGIVRSVLNPEGHVYIDGALWRARWTGDTKRAKVGTPVRVHAVDGAVVLVEPYDPAAGSGDDGPDGVEVASTGSPGADTGR